METRPPKHDAKAAPHPWRRGRRLIAVGALLVALVIAGGLWRLSSGPVVVPFLSTYLAAKVDDAGLPAGLQWRDVAVHWPWLSRWLHVHVTNVRISDSLTAEGLGLRLDVTALLGGRILPAGFVVHAPSLVLKPDTDDTSDLRWDTLFVGLDVPAAVLGAGSSVDVLDGTITLNPQSGGPGLQIADINGQAVDRGGRIALTGRSTGQFRDHPAVPLQFAAEFIPDSETVTAEISFAGLEPRALAVLPGTGNILRGFQIPLTGTVHIDGTFASPRWTVVGRSEGGRIRLPAVFETGGDVDVDVTGVRLQLEYDPATGGIEFREVAVSSPSFAFTINGRIGTDPGGLTTVQGSATGKVPVRDAAAWLQGTYPDAAHAWIERSVTSGTLTGLTFAVAIAADGEDSPEVRADAVISDGVVHWRDDKPSLRMPTVQLDLNRGAFTVTAEEGQFGAATLAGLRFQYPDSVAGVRGGRLDVRLSGDAGRLLQLADINVGPDAGPVLRGHVSEVDLKVWLPADPAANRDLTVRGRFEELAVEPGFLPEPYAELDVHSLAGTFRYGPDGLAVDADGQIGDSIGVRDAHLSSPDVTALPLNLAATLSGPIGALMELGSAIAPIGPELRSITGMAEVRVGMDIPRESAAAPELQFLRGTFEVPTLEGQSFGSGPWSEQVFRGVTGTFALESGALEVSGEGGLTDARASFTWRAAPDGGVGSRRLKIRGVLGQEARNAIGVRLDGLTGPVDFSAQFVQRPDADWQVEAEVDLASAGLTFPELEWTKEVGAPLQGNVSGRIGKPHVLDVSLEGSGMDVRGRLRIHDGRLEYGEFPRIVVGAVRTAGAIAVDDTGMVRADFDGEQIDLRPLLRSAAGNPVSLADLRLQIKAERVRSLGADLHGPLAMKLDVGDRRVRDLHVVLELGSGDWMELRGISNDDRLELELKGTESRAMAETLGLGVGAAGGEVLVQAVEEGGAMTGTIHVDDFRMVDAPVFVQLLQSVTVLGLLEQFAGGGGPAFSSFDAEFALADGVLEVRRGIAKSLTLGVTVEGTIDRRNGLVDLRGTLIPAYVISDLLSRIPVIDRVVTGIDLGGVVAAAYRLKGPADNPAVSVSPLEFLAPGILRSVLQEFEKSIQPPDQ